MAIRLWLARPMEPALKQRLIGAAVLVALAVIFLPMLIKGPAPESGASDVPLTLPDAPQGQFETRELPLVGPGDAPKGGVVGMDAPSDGERLPTVDTAAEKPDQGEVMAVGKGKILEDGKVRPLDIKVGDKILFGKYSGQTVRVKGDELLVMREEDIMGVIEGK